jgi:hypothetical protein
LAVEGGMSYVIMGVNLDGRRIWVSGVEFYDYTHTLEYACVSENKRESYKTDLPEALDVLKMMKSEMPEYTWSVVSSYL